MPRRAAHCDIGKLIDHAMVERGWVQADIASILQCSVAYVSGVITGRKGISVETAVKFAAAAGIPAELLLRTRDAELLRNVKVDDRGIAARVAEVERLKRGAKSPMEGKR